MPELPEVETIRRGLLPLVKERTIEAVWISPQAPKLVAYPSTELFCRQLQGRRLLDVARRGKFLLFPLDDGRTWIVHLRMTGTLHHSRQGCQLPYLRARFLLDDGSFLCYQDQRKLGRMWLVDDPLPIVGSLGPEPFSPSLTGHPLAEALVKRRAPIKSILLDQRVMAGIGNIYADEALFQAGIHPLRPAASLGEEEVERLLEAVRTVLAEALAHGGTSFRSYVDSSGRPGSHQHYVRVFRREGLPCPQCQTPITRAKVGGRSTYYCANCQS